MFLAKDCRMVRPLEYGSGLSLEEAEARLREIRKEFGGVKAHYPRFWFNAKKVYYPETGSDHETSSVL